MLKNKIKLVCLSSLILMFSCNDLKKIANQMETIKGNQDIIIAKQKEVDSKLAVLQRTVSGLNVSSKQQPAKKQQQKRKSPNPDIAHNIEVGGSVVLGNPNAKVTITKFTDFQWPFCARSVSLIDDLLAKYPDDLNVVIKNFPLGSHKQARKAAQYALAAHKQGKYKEMYRKIFETYKELRNNEDLPKTIAAELGLDIGQLMEDMQSQEISDLIDFEYQQLASLRNAYPETEQYAAGVRIAVPKFFINGREPAGRSLDQFSAMIEQELKK